MPGRRPFYGQAADDEDFLSCDLWGRWGHKIILRVSDFGVFIAVDKNKITSLNYLLMICLLMFIQLRPAIPDVKVLKTFICYWRIFVIANIGNK